jgi:hypothetical protein
MNKQGTAVLNCPGWVGGVIVRIQNEPKGIRVVRCRSDSGREGRLYRDYALSVEGGIEGMMCRSQSGSPFYLTDVRWESDRDG